MVCDWYGWHACHLCADWRLHEKSAESDAKLGIADSDRPPAPANRRCEPQCPRATSSAKQFVEFVLSQADSV